jgi:hypothetical protein
MYRLVNVQKRMSLHMLSFHFPRKLEHPVVGDSAKASSEPNIGFFSSSVMQFKGPAKGRGDLKPHNQHLSVWHV